ncbi:GIY-YIG nuclease family protein [Candidatus Kaiserbacteria bacterium]|nr:GIY-YIG nuclease family protein [Candidatus Kaiserbacteria bacterium]
MKYCVYMLECKDGTFYTGITTDVSRRLAEHNGQFGKGAKYTAGRRPVKLVYTKNCKGRSEALKEEYLIKQLSREDKVKLRQ